MPIKPIEMLKKLHFDRITYGGGDIPTDKYETEWGNALVKKGADFRAVKKGEMYIPVYMKGGHPLDKSYERPWDEIGCFIFKNKDHLEKMDKYYEKKKEETIKKGEKPMSDKEAILRAKAKAIQGYFGTYTSVAKAMIRPSYIPFAYQVNYSRHPFFVGEGLTADLRLRGGSKYKRSCFDIEENNGVVQRAPYNGPKKAKKESGSKPSDAEMQKAWINYINEKGTMVDGKKCVCAGSNASCKNKPLWHYNTIQYLKNKTNADGIDMKDLFAVKDSKRFPKLHYVKSSSQLCVK